MRSPAAFIIIGFAAIVYSAADRIGLGSGALVLAGIALIAGIGVNAWMKFGGPY